MKPSNAARLMALLSLIAAAAPARSADWALTFYGGYQQGAGGRLAGTVSDLVPNLPLAFSLGVGYTLRDPGNALLARQVFINQNDNGTPETSGRAWDLRLDAIYLLPISGLIDSGFYLGLRRSYFLGDFHYVGGNEDFEITSNQWGWGAGVRGGLAMSRDWSLTVSVGFDHYPSWSLTGHDATYASSGTIVNGRDNGAGYSYTTADADRAVNQPRFVPSVLLGVTWRPGSTPQRATPGPGTRR
jgi:hypothetical protein